MLASPASVSFGIVRPGASVPVHVNLADAGGGAGVWDVAVEPAGTATGAAIVVAPTVAVPGGLDLTATVTAAATDGDLTGFVRLTRGTDIRRIPFWLRVGRPALAAAAATPLKAPGVRAGNTRGKPSLVSRYRYPDVPQGGIVTAVAAGPGAGVPLHADEARGELRRRDHAAQRRGQGRAADRRGRRREPPHGLRGAPHEPQSVSRAIRQSGARGRGDPAARRAATTSSSTAPPPPGAGAFAFRFWVDDTRPPSLRLTQARVRRNVPLVVRATDLGSGIDATTIRATIDGRPCSTTLVGGTLRIRTTGVKPGKHKLRLQASDYQESRNMENVPPILPNTRVLVGRDRDPLGSRTTG